MIVMDVIKIIKPGHSCLCYFSYKYGNRCVIARCRKYFQNNKTFANIQLVFDDCWSLLKNFIRKFISTFLLSKWPMPVIESVCAKEGGS